MTRPINAADALRRAVEKQQVQHEAIRSAAKEIADEREKQAQRTDSTESE